MVVYVDTGPGSTVSGVVLQSETFPVADRRRLRYIRARPPLNVYFPAYTVSAFALTQSRLGDNPS